MPPSEAPATESTALLVDSSQKDQPSPSSPPWHETLRFVTGYAWSPTSRFRHKLRVVAAFFLIACARIAALVPPILIKFIVDAITKNASLNLAALSVARVPVNLVFIAFVADVVGDAFQETEVALRGIISVEVQKRAAVDIFRHLMELDLDYHLMKKSGEVRLHAHALFVIGQTFTAEPIFP